MPAGAFLLASESDSDRLTSTSGRASGALRLMWLYSGSTLGRVVWRALPVEPASFYASCPGVTALRALRSAPPRKRPLRAFPGQ